MHGKFQNVHSRDRKDGKTIRILREECLGQGGKAVQREQYVQRHRGWGCSGDEPTSIRKQGTVPWGDTCPGHTGLHEPRGKKPKGFFTVLQPKQED